MEELIKLFEYLKNNPRMLFNNDLDKIKSFINVPANKESLINFLKILEKDEWYEACSLVKNKIDESN